MSATYKIIGDDGKQYGPVTAEQIRQWVAEGRVESRTAVFVDGAKDWTFVGLLPEFAALFPAGAPPTIAPPKPGMAAGRLPATNSLAATGLVFGIVSWVFVCCCGGFPFNLLGLVFSLIGLSQTNRHPELYEGRSLAVAGLILSILSLLLLLLALMWSLATGNFHVSWNNRMY
jgi:Domain of unknown function (DUF4190)/GYF domain 2